MRWTRYLAARLRGLFRSDSIRNEIDEEMRFHIDQNVEENLRLGMSADEARREAEHRFGHLSELGERGYDVRGGRWLDALWRDLRFGVRQLVKRPGFAVAAVATLALAIGATTAVFSVVDGVLIRPLPYRDPSSLELVYQRNSPMNRFGISMADFLGIQELYKQGDVAAIRSREATFTGGETPEVIRATSVSAGMFDVLGVRAAIGRTFEPGEDRPGAERVALVSYGLWQRRFAGSPDVLGSAIALDSVPYTIVGVMPSNFISPIGGPADVWPVMSLDPPTRRGPFSMGVIARRAPGVTHAESSEAFAAAARALYPRWAASFSDEKATYVADPLEEAAVGDVGPTLWLLLASVAFVLLIASVNVANLLLARAASRREEIAMRAALGASGIRLVRQFVAEGALIAIAGGLAGLALAEWAVRVLVALAPDSIPRLDQIRFDWRVLAFSAACVALCTVVLSAVPALHAVNRGLAQSIRAGGKSGTETPGRRRLRDMLVVAEIALALPLLAGAGLMINSFVRLNGVAPGIDPKGVLAVRLSLPAQRYKDQTDSIRFADELLRRASAIPGVRSAAVTTNLPLDGWDDSNNFDLERHPTPVGDSQPVAEYMQVTPDYFATMGIPLLAGRGIAATDVDGQPLVAVVSQSFVRRHFPGEDPIGMRLRTGGCTDCEPTTIVGVVGDVKDHGLDGDDLPAMYVSFRQEPGRAMQLVVRTDGAPASLVSAVRGEVRGVDPDLALAETRSMAEVVATSTGQARYRMMLLGSFAAAALLLAAIGIYGVTAFAVGRRTREIGIRVALGAGRAEVVRLVVAQGMWPSLAGVVVGVASALGLARFVASMLYGVSDTDPATFVAVVGVLVGVSLAACYVPARRALKVDPSIALRSE